MSSAIISNVEISFTEAMESHGLTPPAYIQPGRIHRFPGADKGKGNTAGWCRLFDDCLGGVFGDYSTGLDEVWQARRDVRLTSEELHVRRLAREKARHKAKAEQERKQDEAAIRAQDVWTDPANYPAPRDFLYLKGKVISPGIARFCGDRIVLPIINGDGVLVSLQFIYPDGTKRMLKGGLKRGCFIPVMLTKDKSRIIIAEGWATAMTVSMTETAMVIAAIDAGNLMPVAMLMRSRYPDAEIIIAGDDDRLTPGNPGRTKANEAAHAVGGLVAFPEWPEGCPDMLSDFNDLHVWNLGGGA